MRQFYYRLCIWLGIYKREDFVTVHEVVKHAIIHYPVHPKNWAGICIVLSNALATVARVSVRYSNVRRYIGALNPEFFGLSSKSMGEHDYWWSTKDSEAKYIRLEALRKMLAYYTEHEVLIKKFKRL